MDEMITVKNVNILDLRKTPKATFDKIRLIKNVNMLLVSPETASYLLGIPSKNINVVAEMPADAEMVTCMSELTINANYLSNSASRKLLVIMGRVIVEPDVTPSLIDAKIAGIALMGKLICPESLVGPLHAKASMLMGKTVSYPQGAVLVARSLTLDDGFLQSLNDGAHVVVSGSLRVLDDVSSALIERKIKTLQAYGSILCRQEHALAIKSRLANTGRMTVIPTRHRLVDGNLALDEQTVQVLEHEQLFCMGDILIGGHVDSKALDRAIAKIKSLGVILCPATLKDVLKTKCDMLDNQVILVEGTLWYVDEDRQLLPDQFEYIDGPITMVIRGELTIAADVTAQAILDRVAKIHNMGEISCQLEHISAIEARLGIREGDVRTPKQDSMDDEEPGPSVGNGNIMVL
jgi:hypothetical protein